MADDNEKLIEHAEQINGFLNEIAKFQDLVKGRYAHAKSDGYDVDALKASIKLQRMDEEGRSKTARKLAMVDLYLNAIDPQLTLPLSEMQEQAGQQFASSLSKYGLDPSSSKDFTIDAETGELV